MDAPVGEVVAPAASLRVEIEQIAESATGPEAPTDEANRSLDTSLLVALSHAAGAHREATSSCVIEKRRVEDGGARSLSPMLDEFFFERVRGVRGPGRNRVRPAEIIRIVP